MKDRDTIFYLVAILLLVIALAVASYQHEELQLENTFLKEDNRLLKQRNHMLENCLENYEAEAGRLFILMDRFRLEQNRGKEWNKNIEEF